MTTITDEAVEAAARVLDPIAFDRRNHDRMRDYARLQARKVLTAALPFMGVGEQCSSQDPGKHPCGEQPSPAVSATAALAPCPFCGAPAEIIEIEDGENEGGSCVSCTRCQASSNVEFGRKENFVSNWNARVGASKAAWMVIEHFERVDAPQRDKDVIAKAIAALTSRAPASTTPEAGTEKVAAQVEGESSREDQIPTTPATVGGERCHADRDGECSHKDCPQLRDSEPGATGRHCPLDTYGELEEDGGR